MLLVAVDLDGTVWDHPDISVLRRPFTKVSDDVLVDAGGTRLRVRRGIRRFLARLREKPWVTVTTLSWNSPENPVAALRLLGLIGYFDHLLIEDHPHKDRMLLRLLEELGWRPRPGCLVYLDDRDVHVNDIRKSIDPELVFMRVPPGDDELQDILEEVLRIVDERKELCAWPEKLV